MVDEDVAVVVEVDPGTVGTVGTVGAALRGTVGSANAEKPGPSTSTTAPSGSERSSTAFVPFTTQRATVSAS